MMQKLEFVHAITKTCICSSLEKRQLTMFEQHLVNVLQDCLRLIEMSSGCFLWECVIRGEKSSRQYSVHDAEQETNEQLMGEREDACL